MTALLAIIITGLITFAIVGEYSRKERVTGYLTPDQGLIRLLPRQAGVIKNINVNIGEAVEKGDKLFSIKIDTVSGSGFDTARTLLTQLEVEKAELTRRRDLMPQQYRLAGARLKGQISAAVAKADRLDSRINLQEKFVQNEQIVLERFQNLEA